MGVLYHSPTGMSFIKIINYYVLIFLLPTGLFWRDKEGNTLLVALKICSSAPSLAWNMRWRGLFVLHPPHLPTHLSTTFPPTVHHILTYWTSKPCPSGHIFDALCLSNTFPLLNIEKMPIWAWFRCSAFIHCSASVTRWTCSLHSYQLDIEAMLRCAWFRCSACLHHHPTCWTSKLLPSGHIFDVWHVSMSSQLWNHAQMDMILVFSAPPEPQNHYYT